MSAARHMTADRPERRGVSNVSVISVAKAKVPTIDLADRLCGAGKMRRIGKEWFGRCPLPDHQERSPSFAVDPAKNVWFCHGCLRGGDVIELARFAWGYEKSEVGTAAAMLLMEFGHEVPQRPPSWFRRQERQRPIRDAIIEARVEVMMNRLWHCIFEPILVELDDPEERVRVGNELWATILPHVVRLIEDRRGSA